MFIITHTPTLLLLLILYHNEMLRSLFQLSTFCGVLAHSLQNLSYFGRFDFSNEHPVADWPGSRLTFFVESQETKTTVSLSVNPGGAITNFQYFVGVKINCEDLGKYEVLPTTGILEFSFNSEIGETYEVSIIKLTEASLGAMSFNEQKSIVNGKIVPASEITSCNSRKFGMLVVGDSITAAYGVEGVSPCSFTAATENILYSYATLVGEAVNADVHTVAWSGKGVVRNYGDVNPTSPDPMPIFYNRTLGISSDPELYWVPNGVGPSAFIPDVVLVTLGSNDYSTQPNPSDEDFTAGYIALLQQIRLDYPQAKVCTICEPIPGYHECENVKTVADTMQATYIEVPDSIYVEPKGCDGHPSIEAQRNIADVVIPVVQALLL